MLVKYLVNSQMKIYGDENLNIENLSHNSQEITKNGLFFAIKGTKTNGEDFADQAIQNGAVCVVSEEKLDLPENICQIVVDDVRESMSIISANYYENPSKKMFIIAVTGTNGKTTTTFMLANVFKTAGKKVGIIGTNGIYLGDKKIGQSLTTPDPIDLQKYLHTFKKNGVQIVCMELSAHALELQKNWGLMTDIALFTNLTQDHLDFFKDMKHYGNAKAKLFTKEFARLAVVNIDDDFGYEIFNTTLLPVLGYSRVKNNKQDRIAKANIVACDEVINNDGPMQSFSVCAFNKKFDIDLSIDGGFNVSNALGVIGASLMYGLSEEVINKGLATLPEVEGRFNTYQINGVKIIVDYAHTPDGLLNILSATKEMANGAKVISVFGCGGNRDSAKREIMGEISCENADFTFITSDNPRFEEPMDIAKQIEEGFYKDNYKIVIDRFEATKQALKFASEGDIIVLAGKGAEDYMDIKGKKIFYSDKSTLMELKEQLEAHTKSE